MPLPPLTSPGEGTCYEVKGSAKQVFAEKGESGSLVYLIHNGRRIPFGDVYLRSKGMQTSGAEIHETK